MHASYASFFLSKTATLVDCMCYKPVYTRVTTTTKQLEGEQDIHASLITSTISVSVNQYDPSSDQRPSLFIHFYPFQPIHSNQPSPKQKLHPPPIFNALSPQEAHRTAQARRAAAPLVAPHQDIGGEETDENRREGWVFGDGKS
jgi:hypothetical protein